MFVFNRKVSHERRKQLQSFQRQVGVRFNNLSLLDRAFIHRSSVKNHNDSNERLEFLGDSVLGLSVATIVFNKFPQMTEGDLAKIKSAVVSEDSLAEVANELHVADCLVLGKGELLSGGLEKKAISADCLEAIIGAVYLDGGYKTAFNFVKRIIEKQLQLVVQHKRYEDFKSVLQEVAQRRFKTLPQYKLEKTEGPDHALSFWVSLTLNDRRFGPCVAKTKKDAEQEVAALALKSLQKTSDS